MPEGTPTHVIEALLTLAVTQPTIGCRQYADRLEDQDFSITKSTVQSARWPGWANVLEHCHRRGRDRNRSVGDCSVDTRASPGNRTNTAFNRRIATDQPERLKFRAAKLSNILTRLPPVLSNLAEQRPSQPVHHVDRGPLSV